MSSLPPLPLLHCLPIPLTSKEFVESAKKDIHQRYSGRREAFSQPLWERVPPQTQQQPQQLSQQQQQHQQQQQ